MARRSKRVKGDEEVAGVPVWSTAWPTRPSTHVVRADYNKKQVILTFAHVFAAKKQFELLLDGDNYKWLDNKTVMTDRGVKIQSDQLEEIVEYDFTKTEQEWDFPAPYPQYARQFLHGQYQTEEEKKERNERLGVTGERPPKEPRQKRPSKEGLVTVQAICEELGIDPRDARAALRKTKEPKPDCGWAFDEANADRIRKMLQKEVK